VQVSNIFVEESMQDLPEIRANEVFVKNNGLRKVFHVGSTSSCRQHIRQHYAVYKKKCAEQNIPEINRAIPRQLLKEMDSARRNKKTIQMKLDSVFAKAAGPAKEFSHEGTLHAVAQFVVCDNQVCVER
jgi:hypothetical protein